MQGKNTNQIKVMIIDDHALFRQGLKSLLQNYNDISIIGEAATGREALAIIPLLVPQVLLIDIGIPGMSGMETTRLVQKNYPTIKIVVVSRYNESEYILLMLKAGAVGYIPKTAPICDLITAIRAVTKGWIYLHPSVTGHLIDNYPLVKKADEVKVEHLTNREQEILYLLAAGYENRKIASELFISMKTVLKHESQCISKLKLRNHFDLIHYAVANGAIKKPPVN